MIFEDAPGASGSLSAEAVEEALSARDDGAPWPEAPPEALVYRVATSGTTGRPKIVAVRHAGLSAYLGWTTRSLGLVPSDRSALVTSLAFDLGLTNLFGALASGGSVRLLDDDERKAPARALDTIVDGGVTWLKTTPSWLAAVLADPGAARLGESALRLVMTAGERQDRAVSEALSRLAPAVVAHGSYGPTETTISCAGGPLTSDPHTLTDLGAPIGGATLMVLGPDLNPVPVGAEGELFVGGDGLARGYDSRPGETATAFIAAPSHPELAAAPGSRIYRTGDRVRRRFDGGLDFLGRRDGQLKRAGQRIEVAEIEAALLEVPGVKRALVEANEDRLVAYVVGDPPPSASIVRSAVADRLPAAAVPSVVVPLSSFPTDANGKVDRKALPAPASAPRSVRAPASGDEALVAALFAELTGASEVDVEDDFFGLGGHSLLVMTLLSRLRAATGVEPSLAAVYAAPTPAAIARHLATARPARPPVGPVERDAEAPVSFSQQRLWFIDRLAGGTSAYNMPEALRLSGPLDRGALQQALTSLVERHESLRTTFSEEAGAPVQIIHPPTPLPLPVEDFSSLPEAEREEAARRVIDEEWHEPFDLAAGPVFRARLIKLGPSDHILLRSCHHIISDGWSAGVMNRDLDALYSAFGQGTQSPLEPLRVQYADYAIWQRDRAADGSLAKGLDWWARTLEGAPRVFTLPTKRPRPPRQTFRAKLARASVSAEATAKLRALAETEGTTLFCALAAIFSVLAGREAGANDLVLGTVVANRDDPATEPMVGFFVNTLALRLAPRPDASFRDNLAATKPVIASAFAHQDTPFEQLVDHLAPRRNLAYTPICQGLLTLQNVRQGAAALGDLTVAPLPSDAIKVRFDFEMHTVEENGGLSLFLVYNEDLFETPQMTAFVERFAALLTAAGEEPETPMAHLWPVEPAVSASPSSASVDLSAVLSDLVESAPQAPAVRGANTMTRLEFGAAVDDLARELAALGAGPGKVVAVLAEGPLAPAAILAAVSVGAAFAVLPLEETAKAVSAVSPDMLMGARARLEKHLPGIWRREEGGPGIPTVMIPGGLARSGRPNTGVPAVWDNEAAAAAVRAWQEAGKFTPECSLHDDGSVGPFPALAAILCGASLCDGPEDATVRILAPHRLCGIAEGPPGRLERVICEAGDVRPALEERVAAEVVTVVMGASGLEPVLAGSLDAMVPLAGTEAWVADDFGPLPKSIPGRLALSSNERRRADIDVRVERTDGTFALTGEVAEVVGLPAPLAAVTDALLSSGEILDARVLAD
ncbi:MAG: condensation domain-containing protein, partial [Pseudomonadota bacterium]